MNDFLAPAGGYGRIWECMYEGSMVGAGPEVFCLWPYVISKMRTRGDEGATVMLNPGLLKEVFGAPDEEFVMRGIRALCDTDAASKNGKHKDGRRLVHISGHLYGVVNGAHYIALRSKERHAAAQEKYRKRLRLAGPNPIQSGLVTDTEALAKMVGEHGEPFGDNELTPAERRERVLEKIKAEEEACERVRAKHNPDYAAGGSKAGGADGEQIAANP